MLKLKELKGISKSKHIYKIIIPYNFLYRISHKEIEQFAPPSSELILNNVSPLLISAKKGHTACFELLLDLGANLFQTDVRKWNCLHFACYNGHSDLVKKIIFETKEYIGDGKLLFQYLE